MSNLNNYKKVAIIFAILSTGLWVQHIHTASWMSWWILTAPMVFNILAFICLWMMGDTVWITQSEYDQMLAERDIIENIRTYIRKKQESQPKVDIVCMTKEEYTEQQKTIEHAGRIIARELTGQTVKSEA